MDLKGWHPRQDIPQTQGLADQKAQSATPMVIWLGTLLEEGELPLYMYAAGKRERIVHEMDPALARPSYLLQHARDRDAHLRHSTDVMFWKFLDEHGIKKADGHRTAKGRYRRFPPLEQARRIFRDKYPWWPEFSDEHGQWRMPEETGLPLDEVLRDEQNEGKVD